MHPKLKGLFSLIPWREIITSLIGTFIIYLVYSGFIDKNSKIAIFANDFISSKTSIPVAELVELEGEHDLSKQIDCCKDCHES